MTLITPDAGDAPGIRGAAPCRAAQQPRQAAIDSIGFPGRARGPDRSGFDREGLRR